MKYAAAIAQLEIHARNCEHNAAIQEHEGQHKDAAHNRASAVEYRQAIDLLRAYEPGDPAGICHCNPIPCAWNSPPNSLLL